MPTLQVLVTTMHDKDVSRYHTMKLQSDALFANQADEYRYYEAEINGHRVQQITTATRGSSRNRNIALGYADKEADYIMFSDDDLRFLDGYEKLIFEEFEKHPDADAIRFNLTDVSKEGGARVKIKQINRFYRANRWNSGSFAIYAMAMRRKSLVKANVRFNEAFGPGTENYCGEDTIFLKDLLRRKMRIYCSPVTIGEICTVGSTWFSGHNEKYFYINGKVSYVNHPILSYVLPFIQAYRFKRKTATELSYFSIIRWYFKGIRDYKSNK